ncbi:specifically androgen-regulated gene protein [Brachionichthys hirsutus]|uniref:specifically androgen-regulated gene protein n=1 Tax=Brachionichthys hirsutus TaxID=412623 RepID=UPI003604D911
MPKSDMWPGGIAMQSMSNMDSAGRCDSIISLNSGYSGDSMEHLSAEEKACLMYLEETIESLEGNEDSGLSTGEPESVSEAGKEIRMKGNDVSNFKSEFRGSQESDQAQHVPVNETSEPQSVFVPAANTKASADHVTRPELPATDSLTGFQMHPSTAHTELSPDGKLKIVSSVSRSEIDAALIPPPSDFMDDPRPQLEPEKSGRRSSPGVQEPSNSPPEMSTLPTSTSPQIRPHPEIAEPRSPPAVAPKPKKLPPNIILKSHKPAAADGSSVHPLSAGSDRQLLDPQKVRMEALRKLGLLKSDEMDSGPILSPKVSPQARRSWAAPSPPVSPAALHIPPTTPSHVDVESTLPASSPLHSPAARTSPGPPAVQSYGFPATAGFSDTNSTLMPDNGVSTVGDVSGAVLDTQLNTSPRAPGKALTSCRDVKSATMEHSVVGMNSLGQLRNIRPRPASMGCGLEFSINHGAATKAGRASGKEPDTPMPPPTLEHSGDSQKLLRSQGVSVLICPRSENEDDRREALKRLGLLRD